MVVPSALHLVWSSPPHRTFLEPPLHVVGYSTSSINRSCWAIFFQNLDRISIWPDKKSIHRRVSPSTTSAYITLIRVYWHEKMDRYKQIQMLNEAEQASCSNVCWLSSFFYCKTCRFHQNNWIYLPVEPGRLIEEPVNRGPDDRGCTVFLFCTICLS